VALGREVDDRVMAGQQIEQQVAVADVLFDESEPPVVERKVRRTARVGELVEDGDRGVLIARL
jgi:hypothetical protein